MLLLQVSQDGIEEFDVTAAFAGDGGLPARHAAFLIDERRDGRQALREDENRSRIDLGVTPSAGGVGGAAAMAMPAEDHGQRSADTRRHADERRPLHAVDRPGLFDEALGRLGRQEFADFALGGQGGRADQGEAKEKETMHK